jgi:tetratricopeptide (TPR) repeat protein
MTQHFRTIGDYDNAIAFGQRALAIAMTLEDVSLQVLVRVQLGQVYHAVGDYRRAIDLLRQKVRLSKAI